MQAWQATVQNEQGNIVFNPSVTVYLEDGVTLAPIFNEDGSPKANPFIGSLEGFVQFWANPGVYKIQGANGSDSTEVWEVSLTDYDRYGSYAGFISSYIPGRVNTVSAVVGRVKVSWRRDPSGPIGPTADGGMWSPADPDYMPQHFGDINGTADSATIQAMWNATTFGQSILFPGDINYGIDATINANVSFKKIEAYGARFVSRTDGASADDPFVMFDLNPDADPNNVVANTKSYGFWLGGHFYHFSDDPVGVAALKFFGVRQMTVRDCIFGLASGTNTRLTSGIMVAGLGGHMIEKNRFAFCDIGIDGPDWSQGLSGPSIPVSTSTFFANEFLLKGAQRSIYMRGGFTALKIRDGFTNGSSSPTVHLTNAKDSRDLVISGMRFEQGEANSKWLYVEDVTGTAPLSAITLDGVIFEGNPSGGGHIHMDFERVQRVTLRGVNTSAQQDRGNLAIRMDANCRGLQADVGCRFLDFQLATSPCLDIDPAVNRETIVFPDRKLSSPFPLPGYNGGSFSTSAVTLDMSTLITGNRYPTHGVPPRGYTLWVQARDSASSTSAGRMVEIAKNSTQPVTSKAVVDLDGVSDDRRVQQTVYVPADTDGSIWVNILASGVDTLDLWIYVLEIHN